MNDKYEKLNKVMYRNVELLNEIVNVIDPDIEEPRIQLDLVIFLR